MKKKFKNKILMLIFFLILSGCASQEGWESGEISNERGNQETTSLPVKDESFSEIEKNLEKGLSLQTLLKLAFRRNPSIQASRLKWKSMVERIPSMGSYPDPMISLKLDIQPIETRLGPQEQGLMVQQKIPFPGKLTLQEEMAGYDADLMRLETEKKIREVLVSLKKAYYELFYIYKAKALYLKQKELLERYVAFSAGEHGKNKTKLSEVFKSQSFLAQIGYEQILLQEMKTAQEQALRSLLDLPHQTSLGEPEDLSYLPLKGDLPRYIFLSEKNNEEIQMAATEVEKASKALTLAKMGRLPDFTLEFQWIAIGKAVTNIPDSGKDALMYGVGMNLPIWWHKEQSKIDEKYYAFMALKKKVQEARQKLRAEVAKSYFQLVNAHRLTQLYRETLIPQARQALNSAETSYRQGVSNFSAILETTSVWFNFQLAYWRALVDYNQARAGMENLMGRAIEEVEAK